MQKFRLLNSDESQAVLDLWSIAGLSHRPNGRDTIANLARQFNEPNTIFLGGFYAENLVSVAIVSHNGRKGWINRLAVNPNHRRKNFASELIGESEKWLLQNGIEIYAVLIEDYNDESMKLFEKNGYESHKEIIYYTKKLRQDV